MGELGQILKKRREEMHLSLDDLQEITKIQKRYIDAIERGNYQLLPGPFYTRAFIRNLAETLELNPDQLLSQYDGELPSPEVEPMETVPRRRKKMPRSPVIGPWITKVLLFLFVVMILFIIYLFIVRQFPATPSQEARENPSQVQDGFPKTISTNPSSPVENQGGTTGETNTKDSPAPPAKKATLTWIKEEGSTGYYKISDVDHIELQVLTPRGACWMEVREGRNGKVLFSNTVQAKQEMKWTFTDSDHAYIKFGASKNVDVLVNGQPISLAGKPDVYRIDITRVASTTP